MGFEREQTPSPEPAPAAPSELVTSSPPKVDDGVAQLERELELDLENLQVDDNINTEVSVSKNCIRKSCTRL